MVVVYVLAAGVVAACAFFVAVSFLFFFSVCVLTGAPGGSPSGFPTETVGCLLFGFCRCSNWLSCFLLFSPNVSFYFFPVSFSLLSFFPCPPVRFGTITCNKNK